MTESTAAGSAAKDVISAIGPRIRGILEAAIRSPSGDNCQPWTFRVTNAGSITLGYLPERAKSFFDYQHCGTLISLGAALTNIEIQAATEGLTVEIDYPGPQNRPGNMVDIRLRAETPLWASPELVTAVWRRTVNRRPYLPHWPATEQLQRLNEPSISGTHTALITERGRIREWARVIYLADRIRYTHPVIHEELFQKIQFTRRIAQANRFGLEIDRLGAGPMAGPLLRFLKPWSRMARLHRFGVDRALAAHSNFLARCTGAMALITIAEDTPAAWIRAGQQMQLMWVRAEQQGLCTHPMTIALYLARRYAEEGLTNFLPLHEPMLEEIQNRIDQLSPGRYNAMLFRLGRGWRMRNTAVRMPLERFVVQP